MKISLKWLNEYVDVRNFFDHPQELAQKLTSVGLEVEGYEDPAQQFKNVVVGHIVQLGRHPNADKLTLCQVDVGDGTLRQIVCGAKNHKQGDKVVAALPGAVLPGNFSIKLSKIRDVESQGMLCSESELGFKKESEGILILSESARPGQTFAEYYGLDDIIFEINVTPNRADCLSHFGLAREIAALLNQKVKFAEAELKLGGSSIQKTMAIELKSKEMCPRYAGRLVNGIKVGPSPQWLKSRLEAVGLNSINNVVDVTNYVMMELGQPLHAFDVHQIAGKKIIIDCAKKENFKTLLGQDLSLTGEELTIRDSERAIALAGVMGGLNSGVTDQTQDIFIESAHFHPMHVRRSARRHGLTSESSQRFSRGTDPEGVLVALTRACELIQKVAGGTVSQDLIDLYPQPHKPKAILVRKKIISERLGYSVDLSDFKNWMKRLNCDLVAEGDDSFQYIPPTYRWDLEIEMDLIEEYGRLNGYDKIPETFPVLKVAPTADSKNYTNNLRVAHLLEEQGYQQAVNYAFVNDNWQNTIYKTETLSHLGVAAGGDVVKVMNPLSDEVNVMRMSLLPGLVTNLKSNYHQGNSSGRLFEIGSVFAKNEKSESPYLESQRMALMAWGHSESVWQKSNHSLVFEIKSAIESLLNSLQAKNWSWKPISNEKAPLVSHPGQMISLFYQGQTIGFISSLHPQIKEANKVRVDVALGEFDIDALMRGQPKVAQYKKISKFPSVERDFTFLVSDKTPIADVLKEAQKLAGPLLQTIRVFDVYKGDKTPEGYSSISFRILLQDIESTLAEEKVTTITTAIVDGLGKKFGLAQK